MKIGILGTNDRAVAIGRLLASGGHDVTVSDPNDAKRAEAAARQAGATAETPYHQAMTREVLVMATAPDRADRALAAMGSGAEAVIVDAMDGSPAGREGGTERLARKLDSHRVVRALIVLPQSGANIPIAGDDPDAKAAVDRMFQATGCLTTDRGGLAAARELEPQAAAAA